MSETAGTAADQGGAPEVFDLLLGSGAEFVEIFVEDSTVRKLRRQDHKVSEVTSGRRCGAGLRVISEGRQFLAHTTNLSTDGMIEAAQWLAGSLASRAHRLPAGGAPTRNGAPRLPAGAPPVADTDHRPCVDLLAAAAAGFRERCRPDSLALELDSTSRAIRILNSDGLDTGDARDRTELTVDGAVNSGARRHNGRRNRGDPVAPRAYRLEDARELGRLAAGQARHAQAASPAPTGVMDVVLAPGTAGVVFHETVGHGLEIDVVEHYRSVYRGRVGTPIASSLLTVSDDGSLPNGWGSALIDDEGTASGPTTLVEAGVLRTYLYDRATAARFGGTPTGNSRRASYQEPPFVRMTNTVVAPGLDDPTSIIEDTTSGIYVAHLRGGSFNPGTGDFLFSTSQAYLIEHGRVVDPIRNVTIVGSALDALHRVDAVGSDFEMVAGGRCGKRGQSIPVGFGSPTIRIRALTIGGTRV